MRDSWMDVRHGARSLAARPAFTCAAILTLALGLGVTTAVTSVVYTVVLAPAPYEEPDRLVQVARISDGRRSVMLPAIDVQTIRTTATAFSAVGSTRFRDVALGGGGTPQRVRGVIVTPPTLRMLGVAPVAGRLPDDADDRPGGACVVVLSHAVASARFDDAADAIGEDVRIDGGPCTVMAVMPRDFVFPAPYFAPGDLWLLAGPSGIDWATDSGPGFLVFGRLAPGAELDRAQVELGAIARRASTERPDLAAVSYTAIEYAGTSRDASRGRLLTLLGAAGLVLLIAIVNVVNLQLGRGTERHTEMATRVALGASRGRLVRQLVAENIVLFAAAGVVGLVVATWSLHLIVGLRSFFIPRMEEAAIDGIAIAVCFGLAGVAGLAAGLYPALRTSVFDPGTNPAGASRGSTTSRGWRRFQRVLVGVETGLALVLLAGAALLLRSYGTAAATDPGFRTDDVLHARVTPPAGRYATDAALVAFYAQVEERIAAVPGVLDVALADLPPGVGAGAEQPFVLDGESSTPGAWPRTALRSIGDGYFETLGIRVLRGGFTDHAAQPRVAMVNDAFVRRFLENEDALSRRIRLVASSQATEPEAEAWTIVGVVADAREEYIYRPAPPTVYVRYRDRAPGSMALLAHTANPPLSMATAVQDAVASVDPDQPVYGLRELSYVAESELDLNRLSMTLLALFAAVALVLAIAGIYGVVAHTVGRRLREIGLRMALGARGPDVLWLILGECTRNALVGIGAGLLLATALTRSLARLAPGWTGADWRVIAGAAVLVLIVALLSAYIPARRAVRLDPLAALRHE